jgi:hypothetical protein
MIVVGITMVQDAGEEAFGPGPVTGRPILFLDGDEILCPGEHKDIATVIVTWDSPGGLAANAGNTQIPAEPERAGAGAGTVDEIELGLETVAARRQGDRNGEVTGAGVEVWGELLADALKGTTPFG